MKNDRDSGSTNDDSVHSGDEDRATPVTETAKVNPPLTVDGFTRRDIPELLRQAEVAAQHGDYRLARYEYNLVLRLDSKNAKARQGLRLIPSADQPH